MADDDSTTDTSASGTAPTRRVELVDAAGDDNREALLTGIGLLSGLVLGRGSLQAAASGSEAFASALAHFVVVVLACVAGALVLGRVYAAVVDPPPTTQPYVDPTLDPGLDRSSGDAHLDPSLDQSPSQPDSPTNSAMPDQSSALNQSPESPISPHVAD